MISSLTFALSLSLSLFQPNGAPFQSQHGYRGRGRGRGTGVIFCLQFHFSNDWELWSCQTEN